MKLHIYLFRHGQSYFNRAHKFTGWKDSNLTVLGIKQARKVARKLKNKQIDLAYQSHLSRSKRTLQEVLKFHPECKKIITDDRIIERSYGKLQGYSHSQYSQKFGLKDYQVFYRWHKNDHLTAQERKLLRDKLGEEELQIIRRSYDVKPPQGESIKMVEKRVLLFIKDLLKKMKKEKINVAISAHGNSMRPFLRYFEKLSITQMMKLENPFDDYFEYTIKV